MRRHIENAVTGDRIIFLASPMMGDGDMVAVRGILPPNALGAPLHVHEAMTETFLVEEGALDIDLGEGLVRRLEVGDEIVIEPGTRHGFRNPLDGETRFVTTATPGADLERFLRTLYAMANDGATDALGMPRDPLALASVLSRMDMAVAGVPRFVQRSVVAGLAALARLTGDDSRVASLVAADARQGGL